MTGRRSGAECAVCVEHVEEGLHVAGMDCGDEVALLERRLGRLDGFESMRADVMGQTLRVAYDASRLSSDEIVRAVAETGMRAWPQGRPVVRRGPDAVWPPRLLAVSGVLLAAGLALSLWGAATGVAPVLVAAGLVVAPVTARRAWASLRERRVDMNTLMLVAVGGAAALGEWAEAATVVFLFALAQWLESRSLARARHAIRTLMDLAPAEAVVRRAGGERRVPVGEVAVGETIVVRPGDKLPLDGRVVSGHSEVDQAPITGESLPVERGPGDEVFAGSLNGRGAIEVRVTRLGPDSAISRIIDLVERAQRERAPSQAFVDRFARRYTPAVTALAALLATVPPIVFGQPFGEWLYRALVLLVISCPCALVISTPVAIVSALAGAARRGVLIKGGLHLEQAGRIRAIAFDKTGTLTHGRPAVTGVIAVGPADEAQVLAVAAAVEARSAHPVARAVVGAADARGVAWQPADRVVDLPGRGAAGDVLGAPALVGSHRLIEERGLCGPDVEAAIGRLGDGVTAVIVAHAGRVIGVIGVADRVRAAARGVVEELRALGIGHVAMLTGDHLTTARAVAGQAGVEWYRAGLLPADKVAAVVAIRRAHGAVMMVGDGVNDAPALAASDLGVAMGAAGSDAAIETADAALMADDLRRIPYLVRLGRATLGVIRANVALSLGVKAGFMALAIAGSATLWMAVAADMGASLLVIANGMRLLHRE